MIDEITVTASRSATAGRQPRGIVQLGPFGSLTTVPGWTSWSVSNNSYYEADTFRIVYAASALPSANDANWFSTQTKIFAQIYAGFPQDPANPQVGELTKLIYGRVDDISYNPKTREITLTGRDLSAVFIDNKSSAQYRNQTASQIVTKLAKSRGIDVSQVQPTKGYAGTPDPVDGTYITLESMHRSEWDFIASLARNAGFVVFVQDQSIFFEPDPRPTGAANPYMINWTPPTDANGSPISNVTDISFSRSLTVAGGIEVIARSPNTKIGLPVSANYPPVLVEASEQAINDALAPGNDPFSGLQKYFVMLAVNRTPVQVQAAAQKEYENIISHEMKMTAYLPADDTLDVSTPVMVQGTGTAFDQLYFPRLITREMSNEEGYRMTVEAQNTSATESPDS